MFFYQSQAGILLEPGIGYNLGQQDLQKTQGLGLAAKAGFSFGSVLLGVDIGYNDLQVGATSSVKENTTGIMLGADFKDWRVWYELISASTLAFSSAGVTTTLSGTGSKIGLTQKITNKVNLNLEFRAINFTTSSTAGVSSPSTSFFDAGCLSVSFPLF